MALTWEPAGGLGDMRSCKMEVGSLSLHSQVNYEMQSIELLLVYRPKVDSRKSGSGWWWCYFRQPVSLQFSWSLSFFLGDHYSMIPQWLPLSQVFCSRQKKREKIRKRTNYFCSFLWDRQVLWPPLNSFYILLTRPMAHDHSWISGKEKIYIQWERERKNQEAIENCRDSKLTPSAIGS